MSIGVLLVDDQPVVRGGFRVILGSAPDIDVVGEAGDGHEALALVGRRRPDVVLMDVRMPRMDGLEATRRIAAGAAGRPPGVLVVTTFDLDEYVFGALRAGAAGFLLKDVQPAQLIDAVRLVAGGQGLVAPAVTRRLIAEFASLSTARGSGAALADLSAREREILEHMVAGGTNAQIAAALTIEESTVKSHVTRVLAKLGARNRVQAVIIAYEHGLGRA